MKLKKAMILMVWKRQSRRLQKIMEQIARKSWISRIFRREIPSPDLMKRRWRIDPYSNL